jgi:hypothetical protein
MEIYNLFNDLLLNEGRLEDTKAKYPNIEDEVGELSDQDPSGNNKYLGWSAKMVDSGADLYTVIDLVNDYHKGADKITPEMGAEVGVKNPKDINAFKGVDVLSKFIEILKAKKTKSELKQGGIQIYNDGRFEVIVPLNVEASCSHGKGTSWCIAAGGGGNLNQHFESYSSHSVFYFVKDKSRDPYDPRAHTGDKWSKVAVQKKKDNGNDTFWDSSDSSHSTPPSDWPAGIMETINAKHDSIQKEMAEAKIEALKQHPTAKAFIDLEKFLDEADKKWIIYKIIKTDPTSLNGEVYNKLRTLYSEDEMYTLFRDLRASGVPTTGLNSDSKIVYRKFSRTEEERLNQDKVSFYVYVGDTDGNFDNLIKVDPLDPESHKVLSSIKLKSRFTQKDLYGIKTENGLLDEFVDMSSEEIGPESMESILKKSTKF